MGSSSDKLLRAGAESAITIDHLTVLRGKRPAVQDVCVQIARGTAFSIAAAAQASLMCMVSFWLFGFDTAGSPAWVILAAIINANLGVALGLLCSAFARTELQALQFISLVIVPQLLVAGIIVPRELMPPGGAGQPNRGSAVTHCGSASGACAISRACSLSSTSRAWSINSTGMPSSIR